MRVLIALISCGLLGLAAPAAEASSGVRYGIQDDAWLAHGAGALDERLDRLEHLGVDLVRFNLRWNTIETAPGEFDWEESDLVLEGLQGRGIDAVVGLVGSPGWANGGRAPNFAPGAQGIRGLRARRRDPLPLGEPSGLPGTSRTRRAGFGRPLPPSTYARSSIPRTRRSTR